MDLPTLWIAGYYFHGNGLTCRDVRNRFFFNFRSVLVRFKKNSDSVRNEFDSVRFGYYIYLLLT